MNKKTEFIGIIKEVKSYTGADIDKSGRLWINFIPSDETLADLNKLHKPGKLVKIIIEMVDN